MSTESCSKGSLTGRGMTAAMDGTAPQLEGMGFWQIVERDARHFLGEPACPLPEKLPLRSLLVLCLQPAFQIVFRYRVYSTLARRGSRRIAYLLYVRSKQVHGSDISLDAHIGPGLRIGHGTDIVIGPEARLGRDVYVFNGVTLGLRHSRTGKDGMPTVGDRVILGTGSKILGPVHLGDDARVGANAVVLTSVPAGGSAVGNPARIIAPPAPSHSPTVPPEPALTSLCVDLQD